MSTRKGQFQPGNQAAAKPPEALHDATVHVRTQRARKNRWIKAAQRRGLKLSAWITETLDAACSHEE